MQRVKAGETVTVTLPWSEVCMHMRVSDQVRPVLVGEHGATILKDDGTPFCAAVTHGEAGIFRDSEGFYVQN